MTTPPLDFRVTWPDRAAYLRVLTDLKLAVDRECDAVQVGAVETVRFGVLLAEAAAARERYSCRVRASRTRRMAKIVKIKSPKPSRS